MSVQNYNYNFENKTQKNVSEFITSSVEVISCKAASLSKHPKTNGKFYHTTDDDKFYYDWNGQRIQLDIKGESDIEELINQAQAAVTAANTAAQTATQAAQAIDANAAHFTNTDIHVTVSDKNNWNNKQDKLDNATVLSTITSNKVSAWDAVAAGSYDVAGSAATALSSAKDYTDEKFAGISTGVSEGYVDTAISTALDGYAKSSEIPSVSTFVSAGYVDSKVSGLVKSVNGLTGDVNVNTFTDITKKFTTADYISNMSTYQLCKKIKTEISPEPGTAYMAKAILTDYPNSFSGNTGELFIYAPSRGMYIIDMYTTNNFSDKGNTDAAPNDCGKFTTIYDVYYNNGEGKIVELWSASLVCPQTSTSISGQYKYVPTEDWHATSKYYVDNAIAGIVVSGTGVSEEFVNSAISTAMNGVVTESWINNKGYLTEHQSLDGYAKSSEIPSVSGLASEDYVDNAISNISTGVSEGFVNDTILTSLSSLNLTQNSGDYVAWVKQGDGQVSAEGKSFISALGTKTSGLASNAPTGAAVIGYVTSAISTELSGYAKSLDVTSAISTATNGMATQSWVTEQSYLTSHQSLEGYVTTSAIATVSLPTTSISDWGGTTGTSTLPRLTGVDASKYVTANDVIAFIEEAIKKKSEESGVTSDVDYLYVNGYEVGGTATDIGIFNPFVIESNNDEFTLEFVCGAENGGYEDGGYYAVLATVDIPNTYSLESWKVYDEGLAQWGTQLYENNPRSSTKKYGSVTYNSYVRTPEDSNQYTEDVASAPYKYKITIKKI